MSSSPTTIDVPRARAVTRVGRLVTGVLAFLGMLGVLRTGGGDISGETAESLFVFSVHPLTGYIWLLLGLVGVGMCARPRGAWRFLVVAGPLLVVWALIALAVGDGASRVFDRDAPLVSLHLLLGAVSIAAAVAPLPAGLRRALEGAEPPGAAGDAEQDLNVRG